MRNILRYIVCACLALALGGCIKDEIVGNSFCREGLLSLNIGINETRAAGDNDNGNADLTDEPLALNENRIDDYEVFLFASGATGEAKFSAYVSGVDAFDFTTNDAISVPAGALAELFGSGDTCNIYVVANLGKSLATELKNASTPLTLANLKAHIVSADFTTPEVIVGWDISEYNSAPIQPNFVMDSTGTDTVTKSGNNLSGEVYITRAASKISFMAYIGESMTIDGKVWIPDLENIKVAFNNVVEKGAIDNGSDTEDTFSMPQVEGLYKDLSGVQLITDDNVYTQTPEFEGVVQGVSSWQKVGILVPFYTYSSIWNANENKVDPSIVLTVPWFVETDKTTTLTNYNYTIPLTAANGDLKLVRNKHYRIALRVGVLGDLDQLASSEFSYEVLDWVGNDINVDLSDPKYLVVEKDYVEMNNQESAVVGFAASDTVESAIVTVVKPIVTTEVPSYPEYTTADAWNALNNKDFNITTDNVNKTITLEHQLDNDRDSNYYDYVPYEIYVKVTMKVGDTTYEEEIKFVQYPAFYIIADTNDDYYYDADGNKDTSNNTYHGGVYVNGNRYDIDSDHNDYGGANHLGSATNKNPNMYVINVSALDSDLGFVIGDPRKRVVDNIPTGDYCPSSAMYRTGTNNTLTYYYPTDDSASTKNMIAPKFRIASSYGVTSSGSYDNMRRRCATYQEDGYPAGRWRMPTHAEIDYIVKLSCRGLIPQLFNYAEDATSGDYWCAHGYVLPHNAANGGYAELKETTSTTESHAVRCVYDEWYWSDKCSKTTFTWGDMAR